MIMSSFGPCSKAAMIEGSKKFSKDLMKKYGIPTAEYETFTDFEKALEYIHSVNHPIVIKASGLAAGKGVVLPEKGDEEAALKSIMIDNEFGSAGNEVVIEERLVEFIRLVLLFRMEKRCLCCVLLMVKLLWLCLLLRIIRELMIMMKV